VKSRLYTGTLRHRRTSPKAYQFTYGVFYCGLDLDEIDEVNRKVRFFSHNGRNALSFRDSDHMAAPGRSLRESVHAHLAQRGIDLERDGGSASLLTNTRIFGYVFNPVSFYFVRDAGGALRSILAEVHNTSGEMHVYDLERLPNEDADTYVARVDKRFYVSPFIDMDAWYEFRCKQDSRGRWDIRIDEYQGDELFFQAQLRVAPRPLTNANVLKMLARYPLMTLRTIVLIHWHGLKLWLRGVRYQPNPKGKAAPR